MLKRQVLLVAILLVEMLGCRKKPATDAVDEPDVIEDGGFVEISLDEEADDLDALLGSELMKATAECGNLKKMEPAALLGELTDAEVICLDDKLRETEQQTFMDKISRVLMADAVAKGDVHRWEAVTQRHLTKIDRSDPDLSLKYARRLSDKGPEFADEAIYWADVALENRSRWKGKTYVARVNALYRLRSMAANNEWTWLEQEYVKDPSSEMDDRRNKARNRAKNLAREWLEYATSSGQDTALAKQLCQSASGHGDFCEVTAP